MQNGKNGNRLPRSGVALFSRRARAWIVSLVAVCLVSFVLIPFLLSRADGVNAVYVSADAIIITQPTPSPAPRELNLAASETEPAVEESPVPTSSVQVSQYSLLQENDDYPAVEKLQTRLMELGYLDSDEPSTHYGSATTNAVSLVQRTMSADMDGVATSELQEYLYGDSAVPYEVRLGDSGADVESMQSRLYELGYYSDKINGYFGVATESALQAFETKNKISVDGVFSVSDRELLYSPAAKPRIDPTPTPSPTPKKTSKPTAKPATTSSGSSSSGSSVNTDTPTAATDAPAVTESGTTGGGSYDASYSASGLISVATAMKGVRYSWSQESPDKGFDCSGLVYFCLRTCGVSTSRYSASGFSQVSRWALISSASDLQRGDLVFFKNDSSSNVSHTGIYMGSGSFIHASSSAGKVIVSSISTAYWTRNFVCGRRVF